MKKEPRSSLQVSPMAAILLLALGFAETLLALFQWMELFVIRSGGQAVCSISQTVDCEVVWNSAFASRIHQTLGVPVAGLGIVWGATAFGLSLLLVHRLLSGSSPGASIVALRLTSAVGILACISFAVASLKLGAVCLTCLGTFALVLGFALTAARLLPGPLTPTRPELGRGLIWASGLAIPAYLVVLAPGLSTPKATGTAVTSLQQGARTEDESVLRLREFLMKLPAAEQQAVSDALARYQRSPVAAAQAFGVRNHLGPANAPVKFVEFTDIRCGHCAQLIQVMKQIERVVPEGRIAIEARNFPLDHACNPGLQGLDETGVRCLGAKLQICLEGTPDFWTLREKLFEEQESLTSERALQIASSGSLRRAALEECVASSKTAQLLKEDIDYAMRYSPQGTPLILINGREALFVPSFLLAMAMTGGNPRSPAFEGLPPPRASLP